MNEKTKKSLKPILDEGAKIAEFATNRKFAMIFLIVGIVLVVTLLQSRSYLNPQTDQTKYEEGIAEINIVTVDRDLLNELYGTIEDKDIEVETNYNPDRNNPFSEQ